MRSGGPNIRYTHTFAEVVRILRDMPCFRHLDGARWLSLKVASEPFKYGRYVPPSWYKCSCTERMIGEGSCTWRESEGFYHLPAALKRISQFFGVCCSACGIIIPGPPVQDFTWDAYCGANGHWICGTCAKNHRQFASRHVVDTDVETTLSLVLWLSHVALSKPGWFIHRRLHSEYDCLRGRRYKDWLRSQAEPVIAGMCDRSTVEAK